MSSGSTQTSGSEVRIGTAIGGGYRVGKLDLGGRFPAYDIGHAGDSMGLMATIGYTFVSF